jgi:hypothetical protein
MSICFYSFLTLTLFLFFHVRLTDHLPKTCVTSFGSKLPLVLQFLNTAGRKFCWCMFFISSSVLFMNELMWFGSTEFPCIVSLDFFFDVVGQFQYGWNNQTYSFRC